MIASAFIAGTVAIAVVLAKVLVWLAGITAAWLDRAFSIS